MLAACTPQRLSLATPPPAPKKGASLAYIGNQAYVPLPARSHVFALTVLCNVQRRVRVPAGRIALPEDEQNAHILCAASYTTLQVLIIVCRDWVSASRRSVVIQCADHLLPAVATRRSSTPPPSPASLSRRPSLSNTNHNPPLLPTGTRASASIASRRL